VEEDYSGPMYQITTTQVDLVVTPLHKMFVNQKLLFAKDIEGKQVSYKKDAKWVGENMVNKVILHDFSNKKMLGFYAEVDIDDWLEFIGYYISEGHTTKRGNKYQVGIAQSNGLKKDKIRECLKRLPFKFSETDKSFWIYNGVLGSYLHNLGKCYDKYIPKEFLNLPTDKLNILYDALMLGDGNYSETFRCYNTSSFVLASQFQELLLKIGKSGNIYIIDNIGRKAPNGITRRLCYRIGIVENKNTPIVNKHSKSDKWVDYSGKIYCVEVPNHIIYVRRNGKPVWSGNSFWSIALACGCYEDNYAPFRRKGFMYLGDIQATLTQAPKPPSQKEGLDKIEDEGNKIKGISFLDKFERMKIDSSICKVCGRRDFEKLPDNKKRCLHCMATWEDKE